MCGTCGCDDIHHHDQTKSIELDHDIQAFNHQFSTHNKLHFNEKNIYALNLVSSPGAGKTTLLTSTIKSINNILPITVIEGDQHTDEDTQLITKAGAIAWQINTGKICHLDAKMIHELLHQKNIASNSVLFIENVGNLVCPALFDLGEHCRVVITSVTEGDNKPLKYPYMFASSQLMIINKIDLLPYVQFDIARCIKNAKQVNPKLKIISLSATTGEGMEKWIDFIKHQSHGLTTA